MDEPSVWSELANAYLEHSMVHDAIAAYLRAADTTKYVEVIDKANEVRKGGWKGGTSFFTCCSLACLLDGLLGCGQLVDCSPVCHTAQPDGSWPLSGPAGYCSLNP